MKLHLIFNWSSIKTFLVSQLMFHQSHLVEKLVTFIIGDCFWLFCHMCYSDFPTRWTLMSYVCKAISIVWTSYLFQIKKLEDIKSSCAMKRSHYRRELLGKLLYQVNNLPTLLANCPGHWWLKLERPWWWTLPSQPATFRHVYTDNDENDNNDWSRQAPVQATWLTAPGPQGRAARP